MDRKLNGVLYSIQNIIQTLNYDNVDLDGYEKHQKIDYNLEPKYFVMDSLTRCLNMKKSKNQAEQTTHCAIYFKFFKSISIGKDDNDNDVNNENTKPQCVEKLFISSNKNSDRLLNRLRNIFELINMKIVEKDDKILIEKKSECDSKSDASNANDEDFLNALNYKFSNVYEGMKYYLSECCSNEASSTATSDCNSLNSKLIYNLWLKCLENINKDLIANNEKLKNAFQDLSLFYFYLTIFKQFSNDFFDFNNCKIEIINTRLNDIQLNRLHCEVQLVSKYLNEIDYANNRYISLSSDCCIMCNLVLKNLNLIYYGAKNNICSSRFWKLPVFSESIKQYQSYCIDSFNKSLYQDLCNIHKLLEKREYKQYNTKWDDELPYSDEWIDNQFIIWQTLRYKKERSFRSFILSKVKNGEFNESNCDELKNQIDSQFNRMTDYLSEKTLSSVKKFLYEKLKDTKYEKEILSELKEGILRSSLSNIKNQIMFKMNTMIEFYYENDVDIMKLAQTKSHDSYAVNENLKRKNEGLDRHVENNNKKSLNSNDLRFYLNNKKR